MKRKPKIFSDLERLAPFIPTPIAWADTNLTVLGVNELTLKHIGLDSYQDIIGKTTYDLYPKEVADNIIKNAQKAITQKKAIVFEESILDKKTGGKRWFLTTRAPLFDDDQKNVVGLIEAGVEITDRKENERLRVEAECLKLENALQKARINEQSSFRKVVNQVVHDIRSPLASLLMVVKSCQDISEGARIALREAATNIADIANSLLDKFAPKENSSCASENHQLISVALVLREILTSKKYQYQNHNIELAHDFDQNTNFAFINVQILSFKRMISNLINNAVEACNKEKKKVGVFLSSKNNQVVIIIQDNGGGMTKDRVEKIMQKIPVISNKKNSRGIGLTQVQETLQCNDGKLSIDSKLGEGTKITLTFPKESIPNWFIEKIDLQKGDVVVVLDDDTSIHGAWDTHLQTYLKDGSISIKHFTSGEDTINFINKLKNKENIFLLSDFELLKQNLNGLDVIKKTAIKRSILVTSHYNNNNIINLATTSRTKILPKQLAPEVPVHINKKEGEVKSIVTVENKAPSIYTGKNNDKKTCDLVIIDDSKMLTDSFVMLFKSKGKEVEAYNDPHLFLNNLNKYPKDMIFCIDNDLKSKITGFELSKILHKKGYTKLYMISGSGFLDKTIPDYMTLVRKDDIDNLIKLVE